MKKNLTCIVCPIGCSLVITFNENNEIIDVSGNTCPRGKKYAISECNNPERVVTTTIRCSNGDVLPVKTSCPIPKDKMFECMKIINSHTCKLPVNIGDVLIKDVFGANIVACKNIQ